MKKLIIISAILTLLFACENNNQSNTAAKPVPQPKWITKTVADKMQTLTTTYDVEYQWGEGFKKMPNTHTIFILVFTDGTQREVTAGEYGIHKIGDTIKFVEQNSY